jgi:transposase-like protein
MMASNYNEDDFHDDMDCDLSTSHFTPNKTPKPRRQFTPGFKTNIIRRIENGEPVNSVARELNIDQSNIYRWIENKDVVSLNETQITPRLGRARVAKWPKLEKELLSFIIDKRKDKLGVTTRMIHLKALELAATCIENEQERQRFKGSKTFMERNRLSYRRRTKLSQHKIRDPLETRATLVNYLKRL